MTTIALRKSQCDVDSIEKVPELPDFVHAIDQRSSVQKVGSRWSRLVKIMEITNLFESRRLCASMGRLKKPSFAGWVEMLEICAVW